MSEFSGEEISRFLDAIYQTYNYDFRQYSLASVRRRLRMAMMKLNFDSLERLEQRVLSDASVFGSLLQFITVPTSEMFRDPEFFLKFRNEIVPILKTYPSVKIWVAGCSTGEELYSYAIVLEEENLLERTLIYGTDINPVSLQKAQRGIFPLEKIKDYSKNYLQAGGRRSLSDYYTAEYNAVIFDNRLKQNIVFADHSLATDSVFSEVEYISCRNVLIYFEKALQNRAVKLFLDSLCYRGFLGLGSKESLRFSQYEKDFEVFSRDGVLYRKAGL
jgi:chemotaxis protein methyltransferase CheR